MTTPPLPANVTVYAGVNGGGASTSSSAAFMPGPGFGNVDGPKLANESQRQIGASSPVFGGRVGVDVALPALIPAGRVFAKPFIGVFVDASTGGGKTSLITSFTSATGAGTFPYTQALSSSGSVVVAGRVGIDIRLGNTLVVTPYVLGGGVWQKISTFGNFTFNPSYIQGGSSQMHGGSVVGGGLAFKIAPGVTIGPEYQHRDFGTIGDFAPRSTGGAAYINTSNRVKEERAMLNLTVDSSAFGRLLSRFR